MIKDRLVLEILDHSLRQGLLKEQDLDLDKAIRLCRAIKRNRCTETNEERNVINVALNILPEDVWHMVRSATIAIK